MQITTRQTILFIVLAFLLAISAIAIGDADTPNPLDQYFEGTLAGSQTGINITGGTGITVSATNNPALSRVDYTISNDGATTTELTIFSPVTATTGSTGTIVNTFPIAELRNPGESAYNFLTIPDDFVTLATTGSSAIIIPRTTGSSRNYDIAVTFGAAEESETQHTASDTTSTYSSIAGQFQELDITTLLSGIAAGDHLGVETTLGPATHDFDVLGVKLRYESTLAQAGSSSNVALDIGNNGDDSVAIVRIVTNGDTNGICTESPADTFSCDFSVNWIQSDTAVAASADPIACPADQFANDQTAGWVLSCAQVNFTNLAGTATDAQIPNNITIDLAALATAAAANGTNCGAGSAAGGVDTSWSAESCVNVYSTIQDEGSGLTARQILNFVGSLVSCADDTTRTTCTFSGDGVGYDTVEDEGIGLTQRDTINFTGAGVTCSDNVTKTDCDIPGGAAQNLFETINASSGTDPVADSTTDTLNISGGTGITVTGDSSTDTITIDSTIVDTNTNASTECNGTTTYLDGDGGCDDIDPVYANISGDTFTGTITITGAAVQVLLGGGATLVLSELDCSSFANGGTLSTTGSGVVGCFDDDSGAGGSTIILDLSDDAVNESIDLTEVATTGCSGSAFAQTFTEPSDDKLLITCNQPAFSDLSGSAVDSQIPDTITINLSALATALASNPTDCSSGPPQEFAHTIAASGNLTCAQVAFSNLSGSAVDSQIPDDITINLAATATALAANGANCILGEAAGGVDASGVAEDCAAYLLLTGGTITGTTTITGAGVQFILNLDCSGFANGGTLSVTGSGVVGCQDDDSGSGYDTIQEEGTPVTQRSTLNVTGSAASCIDTGSITECTFTDTDTDTHGNAFTTIDTPSGTDPVADSETDTLTLIAAGGGSPTMTITGDSGADSITFDVIGVNCTGCIGTTEVAGIDISDDTNLTCGRSLTTSGDGCDADSELYTTTTGIWIEDPTAADDLQTIWASIGQAVTITSITCESDQTVTFDLQVDDGTPAGVNGSDITCTTFATDSTLAGDTTMASGDRLDLAITSVAGTPTWVAIFWTYTKDD